MLSTLPGWNEISKNIGVRAIFCQGGGKPFSQEFSQVVFCLWSCGPYASAYGAGGGQGGLQPPLSKKKIVLFGQS